MNSLTFLCTLLILFGVNTLMNVIQFHCVLTNCLLGKKNSHVQYQVSQSGLGDSYRTTWRSRKNDYWSLLLSCHWNFVILSKRDCHSFNVEYSLDILCFSLTSLLKSILNTGWWSSILPSSAVSCRHLIFPTRTGKIFHFKVSSSSLNVYFPKLEEKGVILNSCILWNMSPEKCCLPLKKYFLFVLQKIISVHEIIWICCI